MSTGVLVCRLWRVQCGKEKSFQQVCRQTTNESLHPKVQARNHAWIATDRSKVNLLIPMNRIRGTRRGKRVWKVRGHCLQTHTHTHTHTHTRTQSLYSSWTYVFLSIKRAFFKLNVNRMCIKNRLTVFGWPKDTFWSSFWLARLSVRWMGLTKWTTLLSNRSSWETTNVESA